MLELEATLGQVLVLHEVFVVVLAVLEELSVATVEIAQWVQALEIRSLSC